MQRRAGFIRFLILGILTASIAACSGGSGGSPALSKASFDIVLPPGVSLNRAGVASASGNSLNAVTVTGISLAVTAADMTTITESVSITAPTVILTVPSGSQRLFTATVTTDTGATFSGTQTMDLVSGESYQITIDVYLTGTASVGGAPENVTATAAESQVWINWDYVLGASSFNVYWGTSPSVTTTSGTLVSGIKANSYIHTGRTNGTTYYYVVTAVSPAAESNASLEVSGTPSVPTSAPSAPTGVTASAGRGQVSISWNVQEGATSFTVNYGASSDSSIQSMFYTVPGLTNSTAYSFTVTATNSVGEGSASTAVSATPEEVALIGAGNTHSLAYKADTATYAWGANASGQLGIGTTTAASSPQAIDFTSTPVVSSARTAWESVYYSTGTGSTAALDGGASHSLALRSGAILAMGDNTYGQLGTGDTTSSSTPVQGGSISSASLSGARTYFAISGADTTVITDAVGVAAGDNHSLVIRSDNTVWAWGDNTYGQLGDGTTTASSDAVQASGVTGVIEVTAGSDFSGAMTGVGGVWAWGNNSSGQLGNGTTTSSSTPVQTISSGIAAISAGNSFSSVIGRYGGAFTAGLNTSGQLGDGTIVSNTTTTQIAAPSQIIGVAAGGNHVLALKNDGTVWTWGDNTYGQLGDGTTTAHYTPYPVSTLTGVVAIAAGTEHSLALKSDGTIWAWGRNTSGQLGVGTTTDSATPAQVL